MKRIIKKIMKKIKKRIKALPYDSSKRYRLVKFYEIFLYLFARKSKRKVYDVIEKYMGIEKIKDKQLVKKILYYVDMYNILPREYFMYHFDKITEQECTNYITCNSRMKYLRYLNRPVMKITKNKYTTYSEYKKYYKRDAVLINDESDYSLFEKFVKKYPIFVKKPFGLMGGKGIELINSENKNIKELFDSIYSETNSFIIEERIIQDKRMAKLHPESVNSVRICPFVAENGDVIVHRPFLKVGQGDSFVDNGGAGGILALIDAKTGKIISNGMDELRREYKTHPNTKIKFIGFQIPEWKSLLKLADEIAKVHPEGRYIGWDIALSDKGWVIVEGNGATGFIGQQMPGKIGIKDELEELINWKEVPNKEEYTKKRKKK